LVEAYRPRSSPAGPGSRAQPEPEFKSVEETNRRTSLDAARRRADRIVSHEDLALLERELVRLLVEAAEQRARTAS